MTARDEAIQAANQLRLIVAPQNIGKILDSIPNDVLVRLAIERGALTEIEIETIDPATKRHIAEQLYRVVEP